MNTEGVRMGADTTELKKQKMSFRLSAEIAVVQIRAHPCQAVDPLQLYYADVLFAGPRSFVVGSATAVVSGDASPSSTS